MESAGDYAKRLATETFRLVALLAAGAAWAAPAYLAFVLRHDPHVAVGPNVLAVLVRVDATLMFLAPVLAIIGTVVVSRLLFCNAALDATSAIAVGVVITVFLALSLAARQAPDMLILRVVDRAQAVLAIAGIAVTGVALWKRSPLLAIVWVALFAGSVVVLLTASHTTGGVDPDLTRGLRSMAAETVTELTVWVSAFVVFCVQGFRGRVAAAST